MNLTENSGYSSLSQCYAHTVHYKLYSKKTHTNTYTPTMARTKSTVTLNTAITEQYT